MDDVFDLTIEASQARSFALDDGLGRAHWAVDQRRKQAQAETPRHLPEAIRETPQSGNSAKAHDQYLRRVIVSSDSVRQQLSESRLKAPTKLRNRAAKACCVFVSQSDVLIPETDLERAWSRKVSSLPVPSGVVSWRVMILRAQSKQFHDFVLPFSRMCRDSNLMQSHSGSKAD